MFIFTIDDKVEELEKASVAIKAAGHCDFGQVMEDRYLGDAGKWTFRDHILGVLEDHKNNIHGIITDLMFHPGDERLSKDREWPTGIYVVMFAITNDIPVVVCSSSRHGDNDFGRFFLSDKRITGHYVDLEVGEEKDWARAVKKLEVLVEMKKSLKSI